MKIIGLAILLLVFISGCRNNYEIALAQSAEGVADGIYEFDYLHNEFIDTYGPGVKKVRELRRSNPEQWSQLWAEARDEALQNYILKEGLLVNECPNGFIILSNNHSVAGWGKARLRCKPNPQ